MAVEEKKGEQVEGEAVAQRVIICDSSAFCLECLLAQERIDELERELRHKSDIRIAEAETHSEANQ